MAAARIVPGAQEAPRAPNAPGAQGTPDAPGGQAGLEGLFYPRGVAVVGSMGPGKLGYELTRQIVAGGYARVFAVNPRADGLQGVPGFSRMEDIHQLVDLAVVVSPAATVPDVLRQCKAAGIGAAVVISSGFGEVGNQAGEAEVRRLASELKVRVVGPNCAGIVNTGCHLFATLEVRPPSGPMAFISQSGALGGAVLAWAEEQGVGISKFVSYGNRADLDEIELLPYLAGDPETKVVALYIESVTDGRAFRDAVAAFTRVKPLVVIKSGRTRSGQRAALSHTGSLAGSDTVYDSVLRQAGAIRVETVEEMFDLCKGFAAIPPVRGRKIAIVTNSGGPGILAADRAEAVGLDVAPPDPTFHQECAAVLPPHAALGNPVDLTVQGSAEGYRQVLEAILKTHDAALAINVATPYLDSVALAEGICGAARATGKPVAANFMAGRLVAESIAYLKDQGIPNYATGERAVNVLAAMARHEETMASQAAFQSGLQTQPAPSAPVGELPLSPEGEFLEPQAMAWLESNAIPVPAFRFVTTPEGAAAAAWEVGFPAVMKVVSPEILHKSDVGGVILGIASEAEAAAAFERLRQVAAGKTYRGVMVYPLLPKAQEMLVGLWRDSQFGPAVMLGMGGVMVEVWRDVALRLAPVSPVEALAMITELKSAALLKGVRGQPPSDLAALADLVAAVSQLPFRYPQVAELDLNPVFVYAKGVCVGDVRVIVRE